MLCVRRQGNVAIDVASVLCSTVDHLRRTDIAEHALEALSKSRVKRVFMIGRRGPAQVSNRSLCRLFALLVAMAMPDTQSAVVAVVVRG